MHKLLKPGSIAVGVLLLGTAVSLFTYGWLFTRPDPGPFDRLAVRRLHQLCGKRTDCQVRLRDLSDRQWDTLYEWSGGNFADQDVSGRIGRPFHRRSELMRVIVLLRGGQVVSQTEGDEGVESSIAGEVYLSCGAPSETFTACPAGALMRVTSFDAPGDPARGRAWPGTSYSLTEVP